MASSAPRVGAYSIPAELILPVVHEYLREYESETDNSDWGAALKGLCERAGVTSDAYSKWKHGKNNIPFDTADKLMSAMHCNHLWWQRDDLRPLYVSARLSPKLRHTPTPMHPRPCGECGKEFVPTNPAKGGRPNTVYCSPECRHERKKRVDRTRPRRGKA